MASQKMKKTEMVAYATRFCCNHQFKETKTETFLNFQAAIHAHVLNLQRK